MTLALYEFPLNEKVRTYLRIEQLIDQLIRCQSLSESGQQTTFFEVLFSLIETFDRNDVRIDLIKDFEKHESQLVKWSQHPEINNAALQSTLQLVIRIQEQLQSSGRIAAKLKEHKFLSAIRSRFSMIGGNCCFDLPQLYYWFNQPDSLRQADIADWFSELELVKHAIKLDLKMLREKSGFKAVTAENGVLSQSAEGIELVRINCDNDNRHYPTVSGNKYRFTLRFINIDSHNDPIDIALQLACC